MLLPIPFRYTPIRRERDIFETGIQLRIPDLGEVAKITIPDEFRYKGFWKFNGQVIGRKGHELHLQRADGKKLILAANKKGGWGSGWLFLFRDADGRECGTLKFKHSFISGAWTTIHFLDEEEEEFGILELVNVVNSKSEVRDLRSGLTYRIRSSREELGLSCPDTNEIDARLVLGMVYHFEVYDRVFNTD